MNEKNRNRGLLSLICALQTETAGWVGRIRTGKFPTERVTNRVFPQIQLALK